MTAESGAAEDQRTSSLKCVADLFEMLSRLLAGGPAVACDRRLDRSTIQVCNSCDLPRYRYDRVNEIGLEVFLAARFSIRCYVGVLGASIMGFDRFRNDTGNLCVWHSLYNPHIVDHTALACLGTSHRADTTVVFVSTGENNFCHIMALEP